MVQHVLNLSEKRCCHTASQTLAALAARTAASAATRTATATAATTCSAGAASESAAATSRSAALTAIACLLTRRRADRFSFLHRNRLRKVQAHVEGAGADSRVSSDADRTGRQKSVVVVVESSRDVVRRRGVGVDRRIRCDL